MMNHRKILEHQIAYIFGAQSRGKTLKRYLNFLYPNVKILSFLVDDMEGNDPVIEGIPVQALCEKMNLDKSAMVYIATKGIYHVTIQKKLESLAMHHILPVTVDVDNFLRNEYVKKYMELKERSFVKIETMSALNMSAFNKKSGSNISANIYMAKSIYDRPIQSEISLPEYMIPIQVGASLTKQRLGIGVLTDNEGDNISEKNRQYSELTALYWMWKHCKEDIIGLCHYRRHFILPANWKEIMEDNEIDVILPVPTVVVPNIIENYKERHDVTDWEFLMAYLKHNNSVDFEMATEVFQESLYSPCNMFIAKREIIKQLCEWMFPILAAVEGHGGVKEDVYQNRYLGFLSERLMTLFFYKMRDTYKIVYADKMFLG